MLLASKYEEMYAPEIGDFVYITDNAYDKAQIRKMEALIFKSLNFSVGKPLCLHFLRRNSKAGEVITLDFVNNMGNLTDFMTLSVKHINHNFITIVNQY